MFNRYDIVEAHYLFCSDFHDGQWSKLYKRLCKIRSYFKPSPLLTYSRLSENGKEIYMALVAKENDKKIQSHPNTLSLCQESMQ